MIMSKNSPPPDLLKVNKKTDHFFISINKQGPHAFLMLGVYDQNKVRRLLCRVGKFGYPSGAKCDLHLMPQLPKDLTAYKYDYIYCQDQGIQKLYYVHQKVVKITENGKDTDGAKTKKVPYAEEVNIADYDELNTNINQINPQKAARLHLSAEQVLQIINSNGGHVQTINADYFRQMGFLCNSLFFKNRGQLTDEGIFRKKIQRDRISYQAYDISYEQYLEFVSILESLRAHNEFEYYKPDSTSGDEVTLKLTSTKIESSPDVKPIPNDRLNKIKASISELHIGNTCRHSAIALLETIRHAPVSSLVSSIFFMDLPCETVLEYGKPCKRIPYYVLPPPPVTIDESNNTKKKVITMLYSRMENMLLLEPNSSSTQKKFLRLKELYLDIVGPSKSSSIEQLLIYIRTWKDQNKGDLQVLRKTYFWDDLPFIKRQSSTMKLINQLEEELQKNKTPELSS
ncbi:protein kinase family protein [Legionella sp. PC997]|nr:protein kinase family protein [Legionella sp. PC997]